jgi:hypothetical protein
MPKVISGYFHGLVLRNSVARAIGYSTGLTNGDNVNAFVLANANATPPLDASYQMQNP